MIAADPKSAEIIRPILRGKDIKRYKYQFADLWLICTFPTRKHNIDDFPAVRDHLLSFGKEHLEQTGEKHLLNGKEFKSRKKTNNKWYETQDSISYWEDFSKPKILYREIGEQMDACLIEDEIYVNNKCYIITGENLTYLICIFNSKLFNKIIMQEANLTGGKGRDFLGKIFIPKPNSKSLLNELYLKMTSLPFDKQNELNEMIDKEVYRLYSLSDEEIQYIESL